MTVQPSLLVVDDTDANRDALSRRLRTRGYTVTEASDGAEGLALADRRAVSLGLPTTEAAVSPDLLDVP